MNLYCEKKWRDKLTIARQSYEMYQNCEKKSHNMNQNCKNREKNIIVRNIIVYCTLLQEDKNNLILPKKNQKNPGA